MKVTRRSILPFAALLLVTSFAARFADAQQYDGTRPLPTFGAVSGGAIDTVSLQNGNIHIDIPLGGLSERGGNRQVHWIYNAPNYSISETHIPGPPPITRTTLRRTTSMRFTDANQWGVGHSTYTETCEGIDGDLTLYDKWQVTDPDGISHPLYLGPGASCANFSAPISPSISATFDGSGIVVQVNNPSDLGSSSYTIWTPDGRSFTINPPVETANTSSVTLTSEDTNGNKDQTINTGSYTDNSSVSTQYDNLGRNVTTTSTALVDYTTPGGRIGSAPGSTTISYKDSTGTTQNYVVAYEAIDVNDEPLCGTYPNCSGGYSGLGVPSSITLPDGSSYSFTWYENSLGEIQSITLPSGGTISYTYTTLCTGEPGTAVTDCLRAVATRTETSPSGVTGEWKYAISPYSSSWASQTVVTDPAGNDEVHTFSVIQNSTGGWYSNNSYETMVKNYTGSSSSGKLLRTTQTDYSEQDIFIGGMSGPYDISPIRVTTTLDNNQVTKTETDYDSFTSNGEPATRLNPTEVRLYNYGSGAFGSLLSRTDYTYLHNVSSNAAYLNQNIVNRPYTVTLYDGTGATKSQVTNEYDNYTSAITASGATSHDSARGTTYLTRGNSTATMVWNSSTGGTLTTRMQYDDAGNVVSVKDPVGNTTLYSYTDAWGSGTGATACKPASGNAANYVTTITNALSQKTTQTFDSCSGMLASATDPNGVKVSKTWDAFNRNLNTTVSTGTTNLQETVNTYTGWTKIVSKQDQKTFGDNILSTEADYDGMGRKTKTINAAGAEVDYTYDGKGRVSTISNPHFASTTSSSDGVSTYGYDGLDRIVSMLDADGSSKQTNAYTGSTVLFTDEGGSQWQRTSDVSGRLTQVLEPNGAAKTPSMETDYTYDALNNLLSVTQWGGPVNTAGARVRTFTYDSLSRMLTAQNPETGLTCYGTLSGSTCVSGYDGNGNLLYKTDARGITLSYLYDALNRVTQKSASDKSFTYSYSYDATSATFGIGRLTHSSNNINGAANYSYDPFGRVTGRLVCVPGNCNYVLGAYGSYNLAGDMSTSHLANGSIITTTYDSGERLNLVQVTPSGGTAATLLSSPLYGPVGMTQALLSNALTEKYTYDKLERVTSYSAATTSATKYSYALTYAANSNLLTATDTVNGAWTYTYDTLNRISTGKSSTTGLSWTYDAFGNRKTQTATLGSAPQPSFSFSTTSNRIDGYCYDAAGNLLDAGACPTGAVHQFAYDGEGKLISSKSGAYTYEYDGDGYRIAKLASGAVTDVYFYDVVGRQVVDTDAAFNVRRAEIYAANRHLATYNGTALYFNHGNWLGTESARSDSTAALCETESNLPFGESVTTTGTCTPTVDFYTGQLRDSETGDDFFGARYFSSTMGRWISPDPSQQWYADPGYPQSLNLYGYAWNNPQRFIDVNGEFINLGLAAIGAAVGGATGFLGSAISQEISNGKVDWGTAAAYGVGGAATGALAGLTFGGSLVVTAIADIGIATAGNVAGGILSRGLTDLHSDPAAREDPFDTDAIQSDLVTGFAGGVIGEAVGAGYKVVNATAAPKAPTPFGNVGTNIKRLEKIAAARAAAERMENRASAYNAVTGALYTNFVASPYQAYQNRNNPPSDPFALLSILSKAPCAQTGAWDNHGNFTGWSGCQ